MVYAENLCVKQSCTVLWFPHSLYQKGKFHFKSLISEWEEWVTLNSLHWPVFLISDNTGRCRTTPSVPRKGKNEWASDAVKRNLLLRYHQHRVKHFYIPIIQTAAALNDDRADSSPDTQICPVKSPYLVFCQANWVELPNEIRQQEKLYGDTFFFQIYRAGLINRVNCPALLQAHTHSHSHTDTTHKYQRNTDRNHHPNW